MTAARARCACLLATDLSRREPTHRSWHDFVSHRSSHRIFGVIHQFNHLDSQEICFCFLISFFHVFFCFLDGYHHVTMTVRLFEIFQCQTFYQVCEIFDLTRSCCYYNFPIHPLFNFMRSFQVLFVFPSRTNWKAIKEVVHDCTSSAPSPPALYPTFP